MRSALLNVMVQAATKAGRSLAKDFGEVENLQVSVKGPADFVSNADKRAEEIVFNELQKARPTYSFLGEEGTEVKGSDGQHRWIVDPLDGTTNFLHGIPMFACAIALERNNEIVASVIYNPAMEELFTAEKGGGAWLNDRKRLRVANRKHLADAVVVTGINSRGRALDLLQLKQMAQVVPAVSGIRRTGSASTDLAWLAAGRFDGYWEAGLAPWDVAPGLLMLREAGGTMTDYAGTTGSVWNGQVIAGNEIIQGQLLKIVKAVN
ncbi:MULTISPECIES: inositol monophosphatase family protein [unclassified Devosia]|jgi:myo-inositol-1(or 4)-monophosphatase|uniref:inositol monophosphatase family protein n=1 Tax=unclassified Devosia TaxID=196773 RepID=UPI00086B25CE|nr:MULTISPECIES: inositol monophosphatase family protein [unclassified Devosia]MBN9363486.1 inositol monophosphatase [Devosia sp.]ODS95305.1 MAG: inositol monophosphatase [Devosia sp. SCN 66-27]OJX25300.1 MAG: inositol monophosphatase [Devosia sp. 66-14]